MDLKYVNKILLLHFVRTVELPLYRRLSVYGTFVEILYSKDTYINIKYHYNMLLKCLHTLFCKKIAL